VGGSEATTAFRWGSALGVSVALFLATAAVHLLIGVATPIFAGGDIGSKVGLTGTKADTAMFGEPPKVLQDSNEALVKTRWVTDRWVGALLVALGILEAAVAWFALREGEGWALLALVVAGLAMLPIHYLAYAPYRAAGISIALREFPPYQWVPALLLVPAAIAGWIGVTKVTALPALLT